MPTSSPEQAIVDMEIADDVDIEAPAASDEQSVSPSPTPGSALSSETEPQQPPTMQVIHTGSATKAGKETIKAVYKVGEYKANLKLDVLAAQSFMAGVYIAMAGQIYLVVGGGTLGASLFPTGIIAVILTSAELFTGDALIFVASVLGGRVQFRHLVRNWTVSWIFNYFGAFCWAYFMTYLSDSLHDSGAEDLAKAVAIKKATQPFLHIFLKGIGANFMVCVGVWQAMSAEDVTSKAVALWFPIAGFVILGFEHCIANQFFLPLGLLLGVEEYDYFDLFFKALLPATLGNIIGGGFFVGAWYWYVFDSMEKGLIMLGAIRSARRHQNAGDVQHRWFGGSRTPSASNLGSKHH